MPKDRMWDLFGFSNDPNDSYGQQASDVYDDITSGLRKGKKATQGILDRGKNWFDTNLDYPLLPEYKDTELGRQEKYAFQAGPVVGYPVAALNRGAYGLANMAFGSPINAATTLAGGLAYPAAKYAFQGPELALKYGPKVAKALPEIYKGIKNVSRGLEGVQATRMGAETLEDLKQGRYGKALFDAGLTALGAFGASNKPYKYVEDMKRTDVERQIGEAADKELLAKGIDPNAQLPLTKRPPNMPPPDKAVDTTGIEPTARPIVPPKGANANDPFWSPTIESNAKFAPNTGGDVELMIQARGGKRGVDDASLQRLQGAVDRVRDELAKLPEDVRTTSKAKASAFAFELDERDLSLAQSLGIIDPDVGTAAREIRKTLPPVATQLSNRPVDSGITPLAEAVTGTKAPAVEAPIAPTIEAPVPPVARAIEHVGDDAAKINEKNWYHGTGTKGLTPETLDPYKTEIDGLFGSGVYLTDADSISEGYAKARGKRTNTPTVYEAKVQVEKVLDLEKPITPEVRSALDKQIEGLESIGFELDSVRALPEGTTTEAYWRAIADEVAEQGEGLNISKSELTETFHDMRYAISDLGYDAMTHTGGKRTGKAPHQVLIILDPANEAGKGNRITAFGERGASQAEGALPPSITGQAAPLPPVPTTQAAPSNAPGVVRVGDTPDLVDDAGNPINLGAPLGRPVTQGMDPNALPPSLAAPTTPGNLPVTQGANVPAPTGPTTPWRPAFLSPQTGKGPETLPVDLPAGSGGAGGIPPPGNRPVMPNGDLPPRGPFDEKAHTDWMNEILKDVGRSTNMAPEMAISRAERQLGPDTVRQLRRTFMDPNTPQEMRNAIVERLRQEAGLVEQPKGNIRNSIRSLTMAAGEELKRIGPKGEEVYQMIRRARTDGGRNFNRFINPVIDDLNRLKKEPKVFEQVVDYVEGNLKNPSAEVKEVGDKITAINNLIGDEMVAAGLIKKKRADYWTHRYEGVPDGKLKETLSAMGLSNDRIDAMLKKIRESRERKTSAEFQRNDLNVPGYRKDIDVFIDHVRNSSRRLAEVEHWGKGDVTDARSPISKAIASSEDPTRVRNLTERAIRGGREGEPWEQKLVQRHRTLATATQLGLAGISNMSGVLPAAVKMRLSDVGTGLRKAFQRDDPDFKFMDNVNAFREFSGGFAESLGDRNRIYRVFGIEQGQNYLNRMSGAAAHSYTKMLFNELKKNPGNKGVRRELKDLTLTDPDELLRQPNLTDGQIERSMINMTDMVQSSMAGEQLPHGWNRNDILRIPQVFQRTAFQITKAMKDAIKEKPTRALKIAAVGLPLGEMIGDSKEFVKTGAQIATNSAQQAMGITDEDKDFGTEYFKNIGMGDKVDPTDRFAFTRKWLGAIDPDFAKNEGIVRGIGNLEQVFAFGMPSDQMMNIVEHWDNPDDWKAAVGTTAGTNYAASSAADYMTQAWKAAHGNYRDVGRFAVQQIPVVGRGIAREIETTAQQKRRKKKGQVSVPSFPD